MRFFLIGILLIAITVVAQNNRGRPQKPLNISEFPVQATTNIPFVAWSVSRKLNANYNGNAFRVGYTNGGALTTQSIGFTGNLIDTNALLTFSGTNSVYVDMVFDQSGNGFNLTNNLPLSITNCPIIVTNGTLIVDADGRPRAYLNLESQLNDIFYPTNSPRVENFYVVNAVTHVANTVIAAVGSTSNGGLIQRTSTGDRFGVAKGGGTLNGPTYSLNTDYLILWILVYGGVTTNNAAIQVNAGTWADASLPSSNPSAPRIGSGSNASLAYFQEWLMYTNEITTADRGILFTNMNNFYTIY